MQVESDSRHERCYYYIKLLPHYNMMQIKINSQVQVAQVKNGTRKEINQSKPLWHSLLWQNLSIQSQTIHIS